MCRTTLVQHFHLENLFDLTLTIDVYLCFFFNLGPSSPLEPLQDREGKLDPSQGQNKGGQTTDTISQKGREYIDVYLFSIMS